MKGLFLVCFAAFFTFTFGHVLLPWHNERIPVQEKMIKEKLEEAIRDIYNAEMLSEGIEEQKSFVAPGYRKVEFSFNAGNNCGQKGEAEAIVVEKLSYPDVIVLGGNASFSAEVKVNELVKTATDLSVEMQKVGLPFDIPCTGGIGSCNYANPCEYLNKIKCPPEIIAKGWNCRCPLLKGDFSLGPLEVQLPKTPLPAFLVDGNYNVKATLKNGDSELFCYQIQIKVKEL